MTRVSPLQLRPTSQRCRVALAMLIMFMTWRWSAVAIGDEPVDYVKQIKPILAERCFACHGALKQNGRLRLDTASLAIRGGKHGGAVKPGDAAGSALIERIEATDELDRMPPEGEPLKPAEIALIREWIRQGAKAPADEQPESDPRDHWAFKPPVKPAVPKVADALWAKNPIDAFIAAEHEKHLLTRQPTADKRSWLRRVMIDLVGLPPTRQEMDAFLADDSVDAYDKVVTKLLDSPQYGERWGRHWMDIWRYSDWWGLGAEVRNSQKHIWHWRDWIIQSLNADKGYDQMVREMLAADELYPNDMDRLRAGGFLARQYFKFNRTSWLDETVEHTAKAMLGLTYNCAKCHDHKYDPISHEEYYQLRAFFEPYQIRTDFVAGELDPEKNGIPRAFDCNLEATTHLHIRGDDRQPDKSKTITPGLPAMLQWRELKIAPVQLPVEAYQPGLRDFIIETHLKLAQQRITQATDAVAAAQKKLAESKTAHQLAQEKSKTETSPSTGEKTKEVKPVEAKILAQDDFASAKPKLWEMRGGMWAYVDGKLVQSQSGAMRSVIRLQQNVPADFEAKLKYIPTGGDRWKSVGIAFDVTEQGEMVSAYLSSYADGPKSQLMYRRGGNDIYPPQAAQARKVDLNTAHEITLRVRGTLINIAISGEHSIAYRLPVERKAGAFELSTFDAKAQFLSFELRELPGDVQLVEPAATTVAVKTGPLPLEEAKLLLEIASKALIAAKAEPDSIKARAAAARARHMEPGSEATAMLITSAARSERAIALAKADEAVSRAVLDLLKATVAQKPAAQKKLESAQNALIAAQKAMEQPGQTFASLAGALKTLESNVENEESRRKPFTTTSTGRRTALANWITDRQNPLAARVAVNHIWARHMGRPLVATVFDFGRKGALPTHPQLLDWLAVELMDSGWSMKHIHRLIVTSQVYRLSSSNAGATAQTRAADPDNRYYWRANPVRMESQVVRDSLLHLAGELDLTQGGPSLAVNNEASRRRSIYFVHSKIDQQKFLSLFDEANVLDCYRRSESIVPQQALALENSALAISMAQKIAQRITAAQPKATDEEFIDAAFLTTLCSLPSEAERAVMVEALASFTDVAKRNKRPDPSAQARAHLIHALLNHNDFVTVR